MRFVLAWCAVLILTVGVAEAAERTRFVRQKPGSKPGAGAFQTAAVVYTSPKCQTEVVLCAVVHVAETGYFQKIQKRLAASELVLYEAVQVGDSAHPVPATDRWLDPAQALGSMLGLVHQATALDYHAENFVWADVSLDQLFKEGGPTDLLGSLLGSAPAGASTALMEGVTNLLWSAFDPKRARAELANVLATAFDDLPNMLGAKLSRSLIVLRNDRLMQVLDERLPNVPKGRITVLYGAGHMPDIDHRLVQRGWTVAKSSWYSAWTY